MYLSNKTKLIAGGSGLALLIIIMIVIYYSFIKKLSLLNKGGVSYLIQLKNGTYGVIGLDNKIYTGKNLKNLTAVKLPESTAIPIQLVQSSDGSNISCLMSDGTIFYSQNFSNPNWAQTPSIINVKFLMEHAGVYYAVYINVVMSSPNITSGPWTLLSTYYGGQGNVNNYVNVASVYRLSRKDGSKFWCLIDKVGLAYVSPNFTTNTNYWQIVGGNTQNIQQFVSSNSSSSKPNWITYALTSGNIIYTKGNSLYGPPKWKKTFSLPSPAKQIVLQFDNKFLVVTEAGTVYKAKIKPLF